MLLNKLPYSQLNEIIYFLLNTSSLLTFPFLFWYSSPTTFYVGISSSLEINKKRKKNFKNCLTMYTTPTCLKL